MSAIADLAHLDEPPFWERDMVTIPTRLPLYAIGWLGRSVGREGPTPEAVIDRLVAAEAAKEFFSDHSMGFHQCEICTQPMHRPKHVWGDLSFETYGHGFLLVESGERAFVAPRMLIHYVLAHRYRPPDEFLAAVLEGRFLRPPPLTAEQIALVEQHSRRKPPSRWRSEVLQLLFGVAFAAIVLVLMQLFGK